jgi:formate hydrogenlyase subunit 6/NADH:ubiquinone oxidoreductase subunit I
MISPVMPFTKTDTAFTDCVVEATDTAWLAWGVGAPRHLMLDPDHCILCRTCEDVCPWSCVSIAPTRCMAGAEDGGAGSEASSSRAVFVVDDTACTRCSVCADRCPTDALYYARLPEGAPGVRTMASVPMSQRAEAE